MILRLNTNKMEYITFGSKAQLWKILTITYRAIHNRAPKYILDLLKANEPKRDNM